MEIGDIALYAGYVYSDLVHGAGQLLFVASRNEAERTLAHKPLCRSKTEAATAASIDHDSSFELAMCFLFVFSYGFIARADAQRAVRFIRLGCSFNI